MKKNIIQAGILAICIILLNLSWVHAGESHSPVSALKGFAQAYFMLDPSMGSYLSKEARYNENDSDMVKLYLDKKIFEAQKRGHELSYLKMQPIQIETQMVQQDDSSAIINYKVVAIRSINPLFRAMGFIFGLLEEHEITDTIMMVNEDGEWKVGPGAFDLPQPI